MNTKIAFLINGILLILISCTKPAYVPSSVATISLSSDGRYALSTHYGRHLILWDIQKRTQKTLNKHARIHSAYFIQNTHYFLWQDAKNNLVYVQNINGKIIKSFNPGFEVQTHIINPTLDHYIAVTQHWLIYEIKNNQKKIIKWDNSKDHLWWPILS